MVAKSFTLTGDGAVHTFSAALAAFMASNEPQGGFQVKWLQMVPDSANSAPMRIGGSEVTSTKGFKVPAGGAMFLTNISEISSRYNLGQEYYYLAAADTCDCLYAVD